MQPLATRKLSYRQIRCCYFPKKKKMSTKATPKSSKTSKSNKGALSVKHESDDSDSTEVISSSDEEDHWKETARSQELPADYYNIQKLVKYIKAGNPTATIVSLCCLKDYDLKLPINQFAIQDIGGLEVLVNLLESNDLKCRLGALHILAEISHNTDIRKGILDLDGIPLLVKILSEPAVDLKTISAETIANVSKIRLARKHVRKCGGIPKLVDLLDVKME